MCYDSKAQPPELPDSIGVGGGGEGQEVTLTAADGNKFLAFAAKATESKGAQILIYPDVRGLHQFYKELALRFADAGYNALAFDYFGRTAGLTGRGDDMDYMPHVKQVTTAGLYADIRASVAYLQTLSNDPIFTVGFCFGGGVSLYSSMEDFGLKGVIGFYAGMHRTWDEQKGMLPEAAQYCKTPVLAMFGGADQGIPAEQVNLLDVVLDGTGQPHSIHIYENAPHSFFDRRFAEWKNECDDAWKRIFEFVEGNK
jgi:carboxymethylenebutenolidase